VIESTEAHWI